MKLSAIFQIFLIVSMSFYVAVSFSTPVIAAENYVCCEKTKEGNTCSYVPESQCMDGVLKTPTSCELTNFCKTGCCYDSKGDGLCYPNMPKSRCENLLDGTFSSDATCLKEPQCVEGCCVIGTQASLTTEVKCKSETSKYAGITMDFRQDIKTEKECIDLVRSSEKGCCVTEESCKWTTKDSCDAVISETTGFFAGKYCSSINVGACKSCASQQKRTGCLTNEEDVYYFDSCGNAEGIAQDCSYFDGTLCGDSDGNGEFKCESIDCTNDLMVDVKGFTGFDEIAKRDIVRNGESWCMFDNAVMESNKEPGGKDPVGSRYYRGTCINGKQFVEPCADYRKEWCVDGQVPLEVENKPKEYVEAQCRENKWQSCIDDCNTANPMTMSQYDYQKAAENDMKCCSDITKRDCSWVKNKCVPKASPGFKFWEDDGSDTCSKADMGCSVILHCPGWNSVTGKCEKDNEGGAVLTGIVTAVVAGVAAYFTGGGAIAVATAAGVSGLYTGVKFGNSGWELVYGGKCLSSEFIQSANNLCRSYGDCGADVSISGAKTTDGFGFTDSFGNEFDVVLDELNLKEVKEVPGKAFSDENWPLVSAGKNYFDTINPDWNAGDWLYDFKEGKQGSAFGSSPNKRTWYERFFGYQAYETSQKSWIRSPLLWHLAVVGVGSYIGYQELGSVGFLTSVQQANPLTFLVGIAYRKFVTEKSFESILSLSKAQQLTAKKASLDIQAKGFAATVRDGALNSEEQILVSRWTTNPADSLNYIDWLHSKGFHSDANGLERFMQIKSSTGTGSSIPKEEIEAMVYSGDSRTHLREYVESTAGKRVDEQATKAQTEYLAIKGDVVTTPTAWAEVSHGLSVATWVMLAYDIGDIALDETKNLEVKTTCTPWVAPQVKDEDQCEKCNPEYYMDKSGKPLEFKAFLDCSEYRCKSFGASCSLINEGTKDEKCISLSQRDVNAPVIQPWKEQLEKFNLNVKQESRNGIILEYTKSADKKLPIYENFVISLKTDEPSQCKMSTDLGKPYKDMEEIWFGGAQYQYYHTQFMQFKSPGVNESQSAISGGGLKQFNIKCSDAVGNTNQADYVVQFVVSDEPDMTAPSIEMMDPAEETYLSAGSSKTPVTLYVNEPSTCKWDFVDETYDGMNAKNVCNTKDMNDFGMYTCEFIHEGEGSALPFGPVIKTDAKPGETKLVYFKCIDKANNKNKASKVLTLHGSSSLNITSVKPEGELFVRGEQMNVTLEVTTEGGAYLDGKSICGFTDRVELKNAVPPSIQEFIETNSNIHKQQLIPSTGDYTYYIGCIDVAGNTAFGEIKYSVKRDETPPVIIRVYRDLSVQPVLFKLELNEEGTCQYLDKMFVYGEGSEFLAEGKLFSAEIEGRVIYVICQDVYGNKFDPVKVSFLS